MNHHDKLKEAYIAALAPSTWKNKASHVNVYLEFCKQHSVDCFDPKVYDLLSFLLYLSERLKCSGSVMNYFSSVRSWVVAASMTSVCFDAPEILTMKKGIAKNTGHVPSKAPAITPHDFKAIIGFLHALNPRPHVIIAALILGYFTLVRQSNLVVTAPHVHPSMHVIKRADVAVTESALLVTLRSTKTRSQALPPVVFRLPAMPGSPCCPVTAWQEYSNTVCSLPQSPAFVLPDNSPLSARHLLRALRIASLAVFGIDKHFTLHSLRRGATQACQSLGLSIDSIMSAGMWRSSAINTYLQALHISSAPAALANCLGERC